MRVQNKITLDMDVISSSFRDPNGSVYKLNNNIYRHITPKGTDDYQQIIKSGLYDKLLSLGYLVEHTDVSNDFSIDNQANIILKAAKIPFISYAYEWCFSQLQDAALLTLHIARLALEYGMILKDASAYNIQFHHGKPIFIDIGSFANYQDNEPWVAYKQFCQHFLAPLALMAKKDIRLGMMGQQYIDGIPLDLASNLLPLQTNLSLPILVHIHVHAKFQKKHNDTYAPLASAKRKISKRGLLGLIDHLTSSVHGLKVKNQETEWSDYYQMTNYTDTATQHKITALKQFVAQIDNLNMVWDMGSNDGFYSRVIASSGVTVVCFDIDPLAVEKNYKKTKQEQGITLLPLLQDLTNPSSSIGWAQVERDGLNKRGTADLIMALALIHHLAISNHVPLNLIAAYFSSLGDYLIIEFVPKEDLQVKKLLANIKDIYDQYDLNHFKQAFSLFYDFLAEEPLIETSRTLFFMKKRSLNVKKI